MIIEFGTLQWFIVTALFTIFVALPAKLAATICGAKETGIIRSYLAIIVPVVVVVSVSDKIPMFFLSLPFMLFFSVKAILKSDVIGTFGILLCFTLAFTLIGNIALLVIENTL